MNRIASYGLFAYFLVAAISPLFGTHVHYTAGKINLINQYDSEHENKNHFPPDKHTPEKNLLQYFFDEGKQLTEKKNLKVKADRVQTTLLNFFIPLPEFFSITVTYPHKTVISLSHLPSKSRGPPTTSL